MKWTTPRGIRDIPPDEYEWFLYVFDAFRETCKEFNFEIMEPATIEKFEVLSLKSGEDIKKEIYDFEDKAGRRLGLRFDLTVGLTRYVTSKPEIPKPVKLGAFSVQWRYDEPQYGRYRSFYAWDIEIYGGNEIYSAIETILFTDTLLRRVTLKNHIFYLSDRRAVEEALIKKFGINNTLEVMRIMDKWGKKSEGELVRLMEEIGIDRSKAYEIINYFFKNRWKEDIEDLESISRLLMLRDILTDELKMKNVEIDPSIVRGLDYYDGIIFEVKLPNSGLSLVGGGNYSILVKLFGGDFNAFGAAGGVERLIMTLKNQKIKIEKEDRKVFVIPLDQHYLKHAIKIALELRRNGVTAEYPLTVRNIERNLKYAVKRGINYAIFIGKKEVDSGYYTIKNLMTYQEERISKDTLVNYFTQL